MKTITKLKIDKWMLGLIALCLLGALCYQASPAKAQSRSNRQPEVLIVGLRDTMSVDFVTNEYGRTRIKLGMEVDWQSASIGAATVPTNYPAGQAFAYWLSLGYTYKQIGVNTFIVERQ